MPLSKPAKEMTMDLYSLNLSKSAQFYKVKKKISKTKIKQVFKEISDNCVGRQLFNIVREELNTPEGPVVCSALAFKELSEPPFLTGTSIEEEKYCFALFVEYDDCIAITKRNVSFVEKSLEGCLEEFDYERFTNFQGRNSPEYEKVTMNNMAISNAVIRSRSYEAFKLNGLLGSNSSSRSIPQNFRIRVQGDTITLTPNSSRVSFRDKKSGIEGFSSWIVSTILEIKNVANTSKFISEFAAPITLNEILGKKINPVSVFFNLDELDELVRGGNGDAKLRVADGIVERDITAEEASRLFSLFKNSININKSNDLCLKGFELPARLTLNKKQITFHSRACDRIVVELKGEPPVTLSKYINTTKPISMMFNSPQYAYFGRSCFEDKRLIPSVGSILSIFDDKYDFTGVNSEKEKRHQKGVTPFPPGLSEFPAASLFRKIEDNYCKVPGITVCDDVNDEWADHIYFEPDTTPPSITFIHAKFTKKDSHGASSFHEVVAQSLKNIGRVFSTLEDFKEKHDKDWNKNYENTKISRVRGGKAWSDLEKALIKIFDNQNSTRKIVLATPFISKKHLGTIFKNLSGGGACKPHHTQLIWLINTFICTCKELGVQPHILCKP